MKPAIISNATIGMLNTTDAVHVEDSSVETMTGLINQLSSFKNLKTRPSWVDVDCMVFDGDGSSFPKSMKNCTLFADDAPEFYRHCPEVYEQTLLYTGYWDEEMDVVVEVYSEYKLTEKYTARLQNEEFGKVVRLLRQAVLDEKIPTTFVRIAWRSLPSYQADEPLGLIEIKRDRTYLPPEEGDPHLFWHRAPSIDTMWEDYQETYTEAISALDDRK